MLPRIHMLYFYDSAGHKDLEVVVLDCDMLRVRSHLQGNCDIDHTLIRGFTEI